MSDRSLSLNEQTSEVCDNYKTSLSEPGLSEKCVPVIQRIESQNFILYEVDEKPCALEKIESSTGESTCDTTKTCINLSETASLEESCSKTADLKEPIILDYFDNGCITVITKLFGTLEQDVKSKEVLLYEIINRNKMSVHILSYGARLHKILVPDRNGKEENVILSGDTLEDYLANEELYLNATIGRTVGVIKEARFCLNGESYFLTQNLNEKHHWNGGSTGLDRINWGSLVTTKGDVIMNCILKDEYQGYPGSMFIQARFHLRQNNEFRVSYTAHTTLPTPCDISNRIYFNLGDKETENPIYDHFLNVNASFYTMNFPDKTPYKRLKDVANTEYDLRVSQQLGIGMARHPDKGFDCLYQLSSEDDKEKEEGELNFVSRIIEPVSGRVLEIYTSQNYVWFSTCNDLHEPKDAPIEPDYDLKLLQLEVFPKNEIRIKGKTELKTKSQKSLTNVIRASERFLSELGLDEPNKQPPVAKHSILTVHNSKQSIVDFEACQDDQLSNPSEDADLKERKEKFRKHSAFYFQPQNFPNAVNHQSTYPDIILKPGHTYRNDIVFRFGVHSGPITTKEGKAKPNPCCEPECPRRFLPRCCDYCDENCGVKCCAKQ